MDWTSRSFLPRRFRRIAAIFFLAVGWSGWGNGAFAQTLPPGGAALNPFAARAAQEAAKRVDSASSANGGVRANSASSANGGVRANSASSGSGGVGGESANDASSASSASGGNRVALEPVASGANRVDVLRLKSGETLSGTVARISGNGGLTFKTTDGATRTVPLDEIDRLEASVGAEFARGVEAFELGRKLGDPAEFRRAIALLQAARKTDERRWAKEWATAKVVDALVALGREDDAAAQFFLICRLDPYSAFLPSIPLRWAPRAAFGAGESPDARRLAEDEAARWLPATKNPSGVANPLGRLLAASILLDSARYKKDAVEALRDLAVCEPPEDARSDADAVRTCRTVALLAAAQRWRLEILTNPTAETVDRWAETVALLPLELRLGPAFVVAIGNESLGRDDAAADGFLRVALLSSANRNLAERATARAASALEKIGRRDEAETLRRDAERRFAAGR
ncbi:MAG: hypothetical protein IJO06_08240 [Thermoguttaceae bacterium]|nr:hypothetical protein [Thermoguttaceae bacterium]